MTKSQKKSPSESESSHSDVQKENEPTFTFKSENHFKALLFLSQFDIQQLLYFHHYTVYNQGFVGLIVYSIAYFTLGIPLQLSQVLLGYYSKKGYLTVWKICPILTGIGFSMTFINLNGIVISVLHMFYAFKYLLLGMQGLPPYASCHGMEGCNKLSHYVNDTCCRTIQWFIDDVSNCSQHVRYPAWSYYRQNVFGQVDPTKWDGLGDILQWDTLFWMPMILGILYYLTKKGFDFFTWMRAMRIQIIFLLMCCMFAISFLFQKCWKVLADNFFVIEWEKTSMIFRLISTSFNVVIENVAFSSGVVISIGSYMEAKCSLQRHVIVACLIKLILQFLFTSLIIISACSISSMSNVDVHCILLISDWDPIYAIITQYISEVKVALVMFSFVYFSVMVILLMVYMVIHILFITNSIMELFPKMNISKTYILIGFFAIITMYSLILHGPSVGFMMFLLINAVHLQTTMVMVILYAIFILWGYGVNRLSDDLYFITKTKPSLYWKITWHIAATLVLILGPMTLYIDVNHSNLNREQNSAAIVFIILVNLPIILTAVFQYFEALKANQVISLFKPDPSWGPPQEELRLERQNFNPSAFIRHKEKHLVCYHHCLIKNNELKNIIIKSEENRHIFYSELRRNLSLRSGHVELPEI